jgi:carboxyl-terminal processing protease
MSHQEYADKSNRSDLERNRSVFRRSLWIFATILLVTLSFWAGFEKGRANGPAVSFGDALFSPYGAGSQREKESGADFTLFWKAWDLLEDKYVDKDKLKADEMLYGAIDGMMSASQDPYTTFFDPKENKSFDEEISGSFGGIGAELGIKGDILTVIAPLDGTPAQKAGLRAGDKIAKIDGQNSADMDLTRAVSLIRGTKGTDVTLTVLHDGDDQARDITITRDTIVVKSVEWEFKENGVAYVKVSRFGDDTEEAFDQAMDEVAARKSRGVVLDLRNNPGGYLESAVAMAGRMLPKGKVVVMEENGQGQRKQLKAGGDDVASGIETVVLINEGSASASEILAGALKDNRGNVTLVGKKSYGKGSVQEVVPLTKDTSVKITVAKWLTPNGKQINNEGISPDVEVSLTNEDYDNDRDPQLSKALDILKEKTKR